MKRPGIPVLAVLSIIGLAGCASRPPVQTVKVPPRIDLRQQEVIGVVEFVSTSQGKLGPLATSKFIQWARRDQGPVRIVQLGTRAAALQSVGRNRMDTETMKALGQKHGLRTIFTGELTVSDIRPDIQIMTALRSGQVSAQVDATLAVQLFETETGASLWSTSAEGTREVGQVSVFSGGKFTFDADDPERAYGDLVNALVGETTRDFRVSWERQ